MGVVNGFTRLYRRRPALHLPALGALGIEAQDPSLVAARVDVPLVVDAWSNEKTLLRTPRHKGVKGRALGAKGGSLGGRFVLNCEGVNPNII